MIAIGCNITVDTVDVTKVIGCNIAVDVVKVIGCNIAVDVIKVIGYNIAVDVVQVCHCVVCDGDCREKSSWHL